MMIKDLEVSKELSRKELAAVRGGFNFGAQGGQFASQAGLFNFASPVIAVNTPALTQVDTKVDLDLANVIGSLAAVGQS